MSIQFELQDHAAWPNTPTREQFQQWIDAVLVNDHPNKELTIRIVTTTESTELNTVYRNKTGPTNVLSFNYTPIPGDEDNHYLGDLAICAEILSLEAKEQNKTELAHWAHLTTHGILHLLGYDHIDDQDAHNMEQLEIAIMQRLGFANPYRALDATVT